jgi:ribosomal protein S18 acetylase RimI-like enzyme
MDALGGGGLVAHEASNEARRIGLLCWRLGPEHSAEITCLAVEPGSRGRGVGRALLDAAADALREMAVDRAWLVTTNDNLEALALYQKAGYRLVELRPGTVDDLRRRFKPSIPEVASNGIPIRDELELRLEL